MRRAKKTSGPTLTGSYTFDGITVTMEKIEPRKESWGNGTKERGLRTIRINGELRGYIILPHGWGKCPVVQSLKQFGWSHDAQNMMTIYGDPKSEYYSDITAQQIVEDLVQKNMLPTEAEVKAEEEKKAELDKKVEDERKEKINALIKEGIAVVDKMEAMVKRLGNNITDEDRELLKQVTFESVLSYPKEVREYYKGKQG